MVLEIFSHETGSVKQKKASTKHTLTTIKGSPMEQNPEIYLTDEEKTCYAGNLSGNELHYLLKKTGITRKELAHEANISASGVQKWFAKENLPLKIINTLTGLISRDIIICLRMEYRHVNTRDKHIDRQIS